MPVPQPNVCTGESIIALQTSGSNSHARGGNTKPNCFSDASNGKKSSGKALIRSLARSTLGRRRYRSVVDPHLGPISSKNRNAKSHLRKLSFLMTKYAYEKTFDSRRFIPRDGNQKLPKRNKTAGKTKKTQIFSSCSILHLTLSAHQPPCHESPQTESSSNSNVVTLPALSNARDGSLSL